MIIKILGSGQDAGIPHTGCYCEVCNKARKNPKYGRLGPSIALLDKKIGFCYMIDASPDFKSQLDMLKEEISQVKRKGKIPLSGILLTHAHLGHCSGLWQLGNEALNEKEIPVFCTPKMSQFLQNNYPFSLLVQRKNIKINEITPDSEHDLPGFEFIPIPAPHRNEEADNVGYIIKPKKSAKRILYLPDIDHWTERIVNEIRNSDIAIIDGTFYLKDELPRFEEVPHPPIKETIKIFEKGSTEIYLTHINHTNALNWDDKTRKDIEGKGYKIAYDGMILEI